jgi:cell wall-associated NlpC family hydrolase
VTGVGRLLRVLLYGVMAVGVLLPAAAAHADPAEDTQQQIEKFHNDLELIIEDYNKITEELKETQSAASAVADRLGPLQQQVDQARASLGLIAARAYKNGGGLSTANALLSANSTNALVHQIQSLDRIARTRQRELAGYADLKARYEREKKQLDDLLRQKEAQQKQLASRKTTIEAELKKLEDLQRRAEAATTASRSRATTTTQPPPPPPPSGSGRGAIAVKYAYAQLGKPYQWGADGPNSFDCSGLTMMAWRAAGVSLPHNAAMQWSRVRHISRSQLAPGDLVFSHGLGHVGIYIGNDKQIHAPHTGDVVKISGLYSVYGYGRPG